MNGVVQSGIVTVYRVGSSVFNMQGIDKGRKFKSYE